MCDAVWHAPTLHVERFFETADKVDVNGKSLEKLFVGHDM